jgi:hypothetical protein
MAELKSNLQIPEQVKEMVEKAIEQAEQSVYSLIEAAEKSASLAPHPTTEFSNKLLSMGAQNMNAAFHHARNLLRCSDLQEAANLQAQFLNAQFGTVSRQLKELYGTWGSDVETSKTFIEIKQVVTIDTSTVETSASAKSMEHQHTDVMDERLSRSLMGPVSS